MIRKFLLSACVSSIAIGGAMAADEVVVVDAAPAFSWNGFYVGGLVGYGWSSVDVAEGPLDRFGDGAPGEVIFSMDPEGVFGGGVLGYNWQFGNLVVGLEGTLSAADIDEEDVPADLALNDARVDWLATVGPRVGYAFDRFLAYGEGGYAAADINFRADIPGDFFETDEVHHGGYVGGGVDWAVTDNVIAGLNYKYVILGDEVHSGVAPGFGPVDVELKDVDIHALSARLTYKF
jgi:outer membrane immunogenic protein